MHHARGPIPSCGGGVANLHSMHRIQRVRFLVPGLVKNKLVDVFCTGFLSRCCLSATRVAGLNKSSWT